MDRKQGLPKYTGIYFVCDKFNVGVSIGMISDGLQMTHC